ncbi:hypothetical protein Q1695_015923 [Nippostrongylus brasiliensis]|nr:hypothetical protein Q1695_015923 [Nippostrongylus brasiliensis]
MVAILLRFGILLAATVASSADDNGCARSALASTKVSTAEIKEAVKKTLKNVPVDVGDTVNLFITLSDDATYIELKKSNGAALYYYAAKGDSLRQQDSNELFNEKLQSCEDLTTASSNDEPPLSPEAQQVRAEFSKKQD